MTDVPRKVIKHRQMSTERQQADEAAHKCTPPKNGNYLGM